MPSYSMVWIFSSLFLILYKGCRDPDSVPYKELLEEAEREQILTKVFIVFSDVPNPDGSGPMFVADKVLLEGDIVYDAFQKGGNVYVCGYVIIFHINLMLL